MEKQLALQMRGITKRFGGVVANNHVDLDVYRGPMTADALEPVIVDYIKKNEFPMGKVMNSLRLALTGSASGLGIAAILSFIGRKEFARRMGSAAERLGRK